MRKDTLIFSLILVATLSTRSFGYLDPGTGSYVMQMLFAGVLGGLFSAKNIIRQIREKIQHRG